MPPQPVSLTRMSRTKLSRLPIVLASSSPRAIFCWLLIALLAVGCAQMPPATGTPTSAGAGSTAVESAAGYPSARQAEQTLQRILATEKPERDLFDLGRRYRGVSERVERVVNSVQPDYPLGSTQAFWVADHENSTYYQIDAVLRGKSEHLYMYVEEGVNVAQSAIDRTIREFEDVIYPTVRTYFGEEWSPGVDADPRITVLNARIPGVGGYFSSADEYPNAVNPFSNEREMFYINIERRVFGPGTQFYLSTLCHEFQHMVHWRQNPTQDTWINEGASMLASVLCGYGVGQVASWYTEDANVQLTSWSGGPEESIPHYAAAYLFMEYFAQHYGGYGKLRTLIALPVQGPATVNAFLEGEGYAVDFTHVFADWTAANLIADAQPAGGIYQYDVELPRMRLQHAIRNGQYEQDLTVKQFGAKYVDFRMPDGDYVLEFAGAPWVRLFPTAAPSGTHVWWSNRSDMSATSLTRAVDLREAAQPVLRFQTWYDIEVDFDYAYVAVSTDDGRTWETLPGASTTSENPNGNNLGHGFTGKSGGGEDAAWIEEEVSLADYAGQQVLLRFEYVTDDAINSIGFLVDDVAITGVDFFDDAENDGDWEARGFFRTDGILPQRFIVQLVRYEDDVPAVERVVLRDTGEREVSFLLEDFGRTLEDAVLIVSGATPITTEVAQFNLRLRPIGAN